VLFSCVCQCTVNCVASKEPLTAVVFVLWHTAHTAMQYVYRRYSSLHTLWPVQFSAHLCGRYSSLHTFVAGTVLCTPCGRCSSMHTLWPVQFSAHPVATRHYLCDRTSVRKWQISGKSITLLLLWQSGRLSQWRAPVLWTTCWGSGVGNVHGLGETPTWLHRSIYLQFQTQRFLYCCSRTDCTEVQD
jgi:hypothetical protein